jgi:hypothetical protein
MAGDAPGRGVHTSLDEGTLFYMPCAAELLQTQDKIIKSFPEVVSVFGKAGRAATATDPAPLEMFETVINLRSKAEWRLGMTVDKLIAEMDQALQFPDIANAWTMPTRARNRTYYSAQRWRFSCTEMGDSRSSAIARSRVPRGSRAADSAAGKKRKSAQDLN